MLELVFCSKCGTNLASKDISHYLSYGFPSKNSYLLHSQAILCLSKMKRKEKIQKQNSPNNNKNTQNFAPNTD